MLLPDGPEGARSEDDRIRGTNLHGLLDSPEACAAMLRWAGLPAPETVDIAATVEQSLDRVGGAFRFGGLIRARSIEYGCSACSTYVDPLDQTRRPARSLRPYPLNLAILALCAIRSGDPHGRLPVAFRFLPNAIHQV